MFEIRVHTQYKKTHRNESAITILSHFFKVSVLPT
jgi:hypothetical protein